MEIEIRAFVNSFKEIKERIIKEGGEYKDSCLITDSWFCQPKAKGFKDIAMKEKGDFGLRVRKETAKGKTRMEINCKVLKRKEDHNAFEEIAIEIKDEKSAKKIFKAIGMKEFCTIEKKRTTYEINGLLINLEDIKGFKPVIEIEKIVDSDKDIKKYKEKIKELINKLGISKKQIIKRSITYLYMREHSSF